MYYNGTSTTNDISWALNYIGAYFVHPLMVLSLLVTLRNVNRPLSVECWHEGSNLLSPQELRPLQGPLCPSVFTATIQKNFILNVSTRICVTEAQIIQIFSPPPQRPDRSCGPPSLLCNGHRGISPRGKGPGREAGHTSLLSR
jgi:hypothetical protein